MIFLLFYSLIPFLKKLIEFIVLFLYMYSGLKFFFLLHMFFNIIYSILVALGLRCGTGFLAAVASLTVERGLKACRLGCGGLSYCGARAEGLQARLRWPLLLWSAGSRPAGSAAVASLTVERSCTQAYWPCSMWDVPGPGIEPLHWQVDFFTTAPLGKSLIPFLTIWLVV